MFQIGDKVAHPGYGGCKVEDRCTRDSNEYLVLVPESDMLLRLYIPALSVNQIGIRQIISQEQADQLLDSFSTVEEPSDWDTNFNRRKDKYQTILKEGTLEALVMMIKELSGQAKTNYSDKALLPRAQGKLYSEIALAKDIRINHVMEIAQLNMKSAV